MKLAAGRPKRLLTTAKAVEETTFADPIYIDIDDKFKEADKQELALLLPQPDQVVKKKLINI